MRARAPRTEPGRGWAALHVHCSQRCGSMGAVRGNAACLLIGKTRGLMIAGESRPRLARGTTGYSRRTVRGRRWASCCVGLPVLLSEELPEPDGPPKEDHRDG